MQESIARITEQATKQIFNSIFSTKKLNSILEICSDDIVFFCPEKGIGTTNKTELIKLNNSSLNPLELEDFKVKDYLFEIKSDRNLFEVLTTVKLANAVNNISYTLRAMIVFWLCQDSDIRVISISMSRPRNDLKPVDDTKTHLLNLISCSVLYLKNDDNLSIERANYTFYNFLKHSPEDKDSLDNLMNYILPRDRQKIKDFISTLKINTPARPIKLALVSADKELHYVYANFILAEYENGDEFIHCIMSDITEEERANLRLKTEFRRFIVLAEISDYIHIEYDIDDDTLYFIKSANNQITDSKVPAFSKKAAKIGLFNDEAYDSFITIRDSIISNPEGEFFELETELNLSKRKSVWVSMRLKKVYIEELDKYMIYGTISNIDKDKREKLRLIEKSKADLLTNLYNKIASEKAIKKHLKIKKDSETDALFIIDVDNFKAVNDNLGHLYGDEILKDISNKIKETFRNSDILGRIGGDEFIVFMKQAYSKEIVEKKAEKLCEDIKRSLPFGNGTIDISASIGIAFTDKDNEFMTLFKNADSALYNSKNHGKDQYCIYSDDTLAMEDMTSQKRTKTTVDTAMAESAEAIGFKIFNTLYNAADIESGFKAITDYLLDYFNVDRILLITYDKVKRTFVYSYQNYSDKAYETIFDASSVSPDEQNDFFSLFDRDGLFYCTDTNELDEPWKSYFTDIKAKSTLETMLYKNSQINGILCLNDCKNSRMWTKHDIKILKNTAMVLNQFLFSDNN